MKLFIRRGRPTRHPTAAAWGIGLAVCLATLVPRGPVAAQEFRLNAEAAAALWLDDPQSDRFTPGSYLAIRPGVSLGRVVDLQWSYANLLTPAAEGFDEMGVAHFVMAGVRLRPLATLQPESEQLGGLTLDVNLGYVRTGDLDRFGFDAGLGYNFQATPWFALGPVVRYGHIVQPDDTPNVDPTDGKFLSIGLNFAFGPAHQEPPPPLQCPDAPDCPPVPKCPDCPDCPECPAVAPPCPDRDADGVCDADDRCPTQAGPTETYGCPIDPCGGAPLVVQVKFDYDSSKLPAQRKGDQQTMDPVLEAVAKAIAQDNTCRVCVVGHSSKEGPDKLNEKLSRERANAVRDYLIARGVAKEQLPSTGLGARCQLVPEGSLEQNRRVEFRRLQDGDSCPTDCSE